MNPFKNEAEEPAKITAEDEVRTVTDQDHTAKETMANKDASSLADEPSIASHRSPAGRHFGDSLALRHWAPSGFRR